MRVISDIETESLTPSRIHLIGAEDVKTRKRYIFKNPQDSPQHFENFAADVEQWVGHNFVTFDQPVISRLLGPNLVKPEQVRDTLVISRLVNAGLRDQYGGHSLESWARRLGLGHLADKKKAFTDYSVLTPEMEEYLGDDLTIQRAVYEYFQRFLDSEEWQESIQNEHNAARLVSEVSAKGFWFNIKRAKELHTEISARLEVIDEKIISSFKPKVVPIREVHPKLTKNGDLSVVSLKFLADPVSGTIDTTGYGPYPFTLIDYVPFNPASNPQMIERLNEAGWKPIEKTKTHIDTERLRPKNATEAAVKAERLEKFRVTGWKVSETNLNTLPADAPEGARLLAQRLTLASRKSDLEEWMNAFNPVTHRIHGDLLSIGSWTHRMAHQRPNTGNIASAFPGSPRTEVEKIKAEYDGQMRALWGVPPGSLQVGVDMDGAHLRILASFMKDQEYIDGILSGDKSTGTDTHSRNQKALGSICRTRDHAKTFIYTWLNGGGVGKVASILECSSKQASSALDSFTSAFPGLKTLMATEIPRNAARGYFQGIDGRKVIKNEEHGMLAGMLQNAETVILRVAAWRSRCDFIRLGLPACIIALVHDEIQVEVASEDMSVARKVGEIIRQHYVDVASEYGLMCPFDGGIQIGHNWGEAH